MKTGFGIFWRTALAVGGIFLGIPTLLLGLLLFSSVPSNTVRVYATQQKFEAIQHPEQSQFVKRAKQVGGYFTNNGCDYSAGEFRTTTLSKEALRTWYEERYPNYFATPGADPFLAIDFLDEEWCTQDKNALCFNWVQRAKISRAAVTEGESTYLIFLSDMAPGNFSDYRCVY